MEKQMMPSRLLEENGRAHFMTKRFDREDSDVNIKPKLRNEIAKPLLNIK